MEATPSSRVNFCFKNAKDLVPGFNEAAAAGVPVLVHVTAPWCEVCQAQKPVVAKLITNGDFAAMKSSTSTSTARRTFFRSLLTRRLWKAVAASSKPWATG
jgi:thiol-disulfide isomerase/thioredoxin